MANGFTYSINQKNIYKYSWRMEKYHSTIILQNKQSAHSVLERKTGLCIDTIAGAEASAIIYSIAETAKDNNLKAYDYFEYLLAEIPKHMDDHDVSFYEDLLPWSDRLPAKCRKS